VLVKDVGICLGRRDYSETSQLTTIFTSGHGKIRGLAKGSRRTKSKFGGGIELLTRGQVVFSQGRGGSSLLTITEWLVEQSYSGLRGNLQQLYRAYYLAELMDLFTEEMDQHQRLFELFNHVLSNLAVGDNCWDFLSFQVRLLQEVGLFPQLSSCLGCGKIISGLTEVYVSYTQGGVLCGLCGRSIPGKAAVGAEALTLVNQMAKAGELTEVVAAAGGQPGPADAQRVQKLLGYWIRAALNREPKTAYLLR